MKQELKHTINEKGWAEIEDINSEDQLLSMALDLGTIVNHPNGEKISNVIPREKKDSLMGTFSNIFGFDSFPMHTDTAFWSTPAKYVILSAQDIYKAKTLIIHIKEIWEQLSEKEKSYAQQSIYLIKTIHGQHYSSFLFKVSGIEAFRHDPCTMIPFNNSAKELQKRLDNIIPSIIPYEVNWSGKKALIFDNWHTLHGRTSVDKNENRVIKRIYIN